MRAELDRNPDVAATLRASNRSAAQSWVEAVRTGAMSRTSSSVEGREIIHHEALNDRWAALLEPGMQTTVFIDPSDPGRLALG